MRRTILTLLLIATVAGISVGGLALSGGTASARAEFLSWDIISLDFSNAPDQLTANPGGVASARSGDVADAGGSITMTGAGTFVVPGTARSSAVTGGGAWETFDKGNSTGSGTYVVKSVVSWVPAPGSLLGSIIVDNNGDAADSRAGLVTFLIEYSDGSLGVLTVSCQLPTTPDEEKAVIQEGITATKGFVHYWDRDDPALGVDTNRTVFHVESLPSPTPTAFEELSPSGAYATWQDPEQSISDAIVGFEAQILIIWFWDGANWIVYAPSGPAALNSVFNLLPGAVLWVVGAG